MSITYNKNEALELYRIFFTIIICLHHSFLIPFMHHGYLAVEFFFIVSGFMLCKSFNEKKQDIKTYFIGRIKRLYPQYLFALVVMTAYCLYCSFYHHCGNDICTICKNFFCELFMLQGLFPCLGANNYPMWYMAILLWGGTLLFFLLSKLPKKVFVCMSIVFIISFYTIHFGYTSTIEDWNGINPFLRGLSDMSIGILLYYTFMIIEKRQQRYFQILSLLLTSIGFIGIVVCICSMLYLDKYVLFLFPVFLLGVFLSTKNSKSHISYISKYCYPMFLNHALVIGFVRRFFSNTLNCYWVALICCVAVIIYSMVTFHLVNEIQNKILKRSLNVIC